MTVRGCRPTLTGPARRLAAARGVAACVVGASLALTATAGSANAVSVSGAAPFGLTPTPRPDGQARPYFDLAIAPSQSEAQTVVLTNQVRTAQTLQISASSGVTAPNSGSAFAGYFLPCTGPACWITGLPPAVTLAAGASTTLPFTVTVPAGTASRQYLAGITAQPKALPPSVTVGGSGQASAHAIIINQISVGVAVTVGRRSQLATVLKVPTVSGAAVGPLARLLVHLDNTGQTFTGAKGSASCPVGGRPLTLPVTANTILPGDTAIVPVNASQLKLGATVVCTIHLSYGDRRTASWSGPVTIPGGAPTHIVHTAKGSYSTVPSHSGIPTWAIALLVIGALALGTTTALTVVLVRRRRPDPTSGM